MSTATADVIILDVTDPDLAPATVVCKRYLPRPPSRANLWRWIHHGINGVRLPVVYVGQTAYLSKAVLLQWVRDTQPKYGEGADDE